MREETSYRVSAEHEKTYVLVVCPTYEIALKWANAIVSSFPEMKYARIIDRKGELKKVVRKSD